ncbi:hypothetical protein MYG64_22120 (plasmid) [Ensifer adhaerens]|uniref:hypothetical protein n=1 Tax=Ensifer adhaerens TaxID=106592 RepID=UPI002101D3E0|nr:hypothetical protein [Ensifer adhaerens]UTV39944.1 hypothetical protein MYG64_22120 [Ensifer adhaerens]
MKPVSACPRFAGITGRSIAFTAALDRYCAARIAHSWLAQNPPTIWAETLYIHLIEAMHLLPQSFDAVNDLLLPWIVHEISATPPPRLLIDF